MSLVADVTVRRGNFDLNAHVEAEPGEIVAIVGPNGAGKTTLLRSLAGLERLVEGRLLMGGITYADTTAKIDVRPERRPVGYVFQDDRLFPTMSVLDNVAFGPRASGTGRREARTAATRWIDRVGLADFADRRPSALSGGQARRAAIARAMVRSPELLLFDEPASGLDGAGRRDVRRLLVDVAREQRCVAIVVTHDGSDALEADQIAVLDEGRMTQVGTSQSVRSHPRSQFAADLLGITVLHGAMVDGVFQTEGAGKVHVATSARGNVDLAIKPSSVSVHSSEPPAGSARNVLRGTIHDSERIGDRIRLTIDCPPVFLADVTEGARDELNLQVGLPVWISFKATDIGVISRDG